MNPYEFLRKLILPLNQIDIYLPKKGVVVDLGCGKGVISKYLAKYKTRRVLGIDANIKRLPESESRNLKFISADITKYPIQKAEGIVLSDVLHHINTSSQKKLLKDINKSLKQNGVLVIKEIDSREFLRSKLSRMWDFILYPKDKIYYWDSKELIRFLENLNFKVKMLRASRFFPGSTTLFVCKKF